MAHDKNDIHLAIAFDQNFIIPVYVLLTSIFENSKPENNIIFHAIATGVDVNQIENITKFVHSKDCQIFFYEIDKNNLTGFVIPENTHFSLATYYRLFFPALVPNEVERLLYIDIDIVVIDDLAELYNSELQSFPVAAVLDPKINLRPDLGITEENNYFNAGVLLINVQEWKAQDISNKAIKFLNDYPSKIQWVDQDALNAILYKNWVRLDKKYNLTFYHLPVNLQKKNFDKFLKGKVIIHYTTQNKPWLITCTNRLRFLYHHYLAKSPLSGISKYVDEKDKNIHIYKILKMKTKEFMIDLGIFPTWKKV